MSEIELENNPSNEPDNNEPEEGLLKPVVPVFKVGRPKKTDEEKAITRRANLDRRNARAKARREAEKTLKQLVERGEAPTIADFSHTKNNRADGVINPSVDPLYEMKLEYEKKLLDKKYDIENKRLDMYLQKMSAHYEAPSYEHKDPVQAPPKHKKQPQKVAEPDMSIGDKIFNMYR